MGKALLARPARFELATYGFVVRHSIHLSYGRALLINSNYMSIHKNFPVFFVIRGVEYKGSRKNKIQIQGFCISISDHLKQKYHGQSLHIPMSKLRQIYFIGICTFKNRKIYFIDIIGTNIFISISFVLA